MVVAGRRRGRADLKRRGGARASRLVAVSALLGALTAAGLTPAQAVYSPDAGTGAGSARPGMAACGTLNLPQAPPVYQHVVLVMDENLSYGQLAASQAPYLKGLAHACGSELNMHAATHPSEPNYLAATSGSPSRLSAQADRPNIFFQLQNAGLTWRNYVESMPGPCTGAADSPLYKPGHNPALYYADLRHPADTCRANDVPLAPSLDADLAADALPSYAWISPNMCDDMHWTDACPFPRSQRVARGDQWLAALLPRIFATPSYRAGRTLVIITFDEGAGGSRGVDCTDPAYYPAHPDCHIGTVLASAYVRPGAVAHSDQNLYSLLGTTEDLFGVPRLGRAVGQPSMRPDLRF